MKICSSGKRIGLSIHIGVVVPEDLFVAVASFGEAGVLLLCGYLHTQIIYFF
jgi:hypothetical protein